MITPEEKRKANEAAKRATKLPRGIQFAIEKIMPNIPNGCNWGFTTVRDYNPYADDISKEASIGAVKLDEEDVLISADVNYFFNTIMSITGEGTILTKDLKEMARLQNDAVASLVSLLANRGAEFTKGGVICIYNINETNKTIIDGRGGQKLTIPSFKVGIQALLSACANWGYSIQVDGKWLTPTEASTYGTKIFKSTKVVDNRHGLMINIKYNGTVEQAKAMKSAYLKQIRQRYPKQQ